MYLVSDLYKARPHKYIKRERRGDKYVYWYKLPDGRIVSSEGDEQKHKGSVQEHVQRLVAGRLTGVHNMTTREIASEVGMTTRQVDSKVANFYKKGKKKLKRDGRSDEEISAMSRKDVAKIGAQASGFHYEELKEAMAKPHEKNAEQMAEYERRTRAIEEILHGRTDRSPRSVTTASTETPRQAEPETQAEPEAQAEPTELSEMSDEQLIQRLKEISGIDLGEAQAESEDAPESQAEAEALEEVPSTSFATEESLVLPEHSSRGEEDAEEEGPVAYTARGGTIEDEDLEAREAREARNEAATDMDNTESIENAEPEFAEADAPIQEMIREREQGGNPYLRRAREVFERIQRDVEPDRAALVRHMMQAISEMNEQADIIGLENMTKEQKEAELFNRYKAISGRSRIRKLGPQAEEFEKATFMTLDEALHNPEVDVEVQRMKHGYPMKQFMRMKPHLKSSFLEQNPSAPPPFPTFGDMKTVAAGSMPGSGPTNTLSMPEEVYNALPRDNNGVPMIPPAWMPIHLMPAWKYVAARAAKESGITRINRRSGQPYVTNVSPYSGSPASIQNNQASYRDGILVNAIRKYVRMRGEDNLVDIPKSAMSEMNLTHEEIFRGDSDVSRIMTTKIIDNVALIPFIKEEMKKMKKSFSLYVDLEAPVLRKSSYKEEEMRKSLIRQIREIRCKNEKKNFFVPSANRK